ncbi:MAG: malto-oligosyltrehalose trehalohydrolase [Chloroflexaceae bacterium]|nr:malto-oligosyltrehalose trehalohydrolase [Chloroflexaceae bacterium]
MPTTTDLGIGAIALENHRCSFRIWAPQVARAELHLVSPDERVVPLIPEPRGYHAAIVERVAPGARYFYRLDGQKERPDPASRSQPDGAHQASEVADPAFAWTATGWTGLPLHDYIIYELHIGTFTQEGTFDGAIARLDYLTNLGITAVEIMPVAAFPGNRNWGYDGTYPFAVHASYGGPSGLKRFVDACHQRGLAVILDVVYNHFGPEGNYLWDYAPQFFTNRYQTPWGAAINFDGPHSDEVRRFFIENALMWVTDFRLDGLRLDAVHAITDFSAQTFLEELARAIHLRADQLGRRIYAIAESDQNDRRLVHPPAVGGYGLDAQWSDDFHHALHTFLTGEQAGYYEDFGTFEYIVRAFRDGWVFAGDYSPFRQRRHGSSSRTIPPGCLVVCTQNHDQVGNRMLGERLSTLVSFDALKLLASALILSPFIPLIFMGEEYGEPAPFLYFVSHGDPDLVEAVRKGRKEEFFAFEWKGEPPDPQDEATFARSRPDDRLAQQGSHEVLFSLYRELIRLRKTLPALATLSKDHMEVRSFEPEQVLMLHRWADVAYPILRQTAPSEGTGGRDVVTLLNFSRSPVTIQVPFPPGHWRFLLDTSSDRWLKPGVQTEENTPQQGVTTSKHFDVEAGEVLLTLGAHSGVLLERLERDWQ